MLKKYLITFIWINKQKKFDKEKFNRVMKELSFERKMRIEGNKSICELVDGHFLKFSEDGIDKVMNLVKEIVHNVNESIEEDDYSIVVTEFTACKRHNI